MSGKEGLNLPGIFTQTLCYSERFGGELGFFRFVTYLCFALQSALLTMQTNVCEMFGDTDCLKTRKQVARNQIFSGIF